MARKRECLFAESRAGQAPIDCDRGRCWSFRGHACRRPFRKTVQRTPGHLQFRV